MHFKSKASHLFFLQLTNYLLLIKYILSKKNNIFKLSSSIFAYYKSNQILFIIMNIKKNYNTSYIINM